MQNRKIVFSIVFALSFAGLALTGVFFAYAADPDAEFRKRACAGMARLAGLSDAEAASCRRDEVIYRIALERIFEGLVDDAEIRFQESIDTLNAASDHIDPDAFDPISPAEFIALAPIAIPFRDRHMVRVRAYNIYAGASAARSIDGHARVRFTIGSLGEATTFSARVEPQIHRLLSDWYLSSCESLRRYAFGCQGEMFLVLEDENYPFTLSAVGLRLDALDRVDVHRAQAELYQHTLVRGKFETGNLHRTFLLPFGIR